MTFRIGLLAAVTCAAFVLRFAAAGTELWVDELWSLWTVSQLGSPADLLTARLTRNSHPLFSLYLHGLGADPSPFAMRAPSILAGTISPLLAYLVARSIGVGAGLLAAILIATSPAQVVYGSEARGYGLCVAAMLATLAVVVRPPARRGLATSALAGLGAVGVLAHLQFLAFQLALLLGTAALARGERRSMILRVQAPAMAIGALLGAWQLATLAWVPGPPTRWIIVLASAAAMAAGGGSPATLALFAAVSLIGAALALVSLYLHRCWLWPMAALLVFGVPIGLAMVDSQQLVERFLLLPVTGAQVLLAVAAHAALRRPNAWRLVGVSLLATIAIGTVAGLRELQSFGRGNLRGAIQQIEQDASTQRIRVGSDQDFPAALGLDRYRASAERIEFLPHTQWPREGVDWLLLWRGSNPLHRRPGAHPVAFQHESLDSLADPDPSARVSDAAGHEYLLRSVHRASRLSGLDLFVYERMR